MPAHRDWLVRFLENISVNDQTGCWDWIGSCQPSGYGQLNLQREDGAARPELAHRISYRVFRGPIPTNINRPTIDHLCRNRKCVNPEHLETVSNRENILRGTAPSAMYARRTHCNYGHEYTENNLARRSNRRVRECKICKSNSQKKYKRNKKAKAVRRDRRIRL